MAPIESVSVRIIFVVSHDSPLIVAAVLRDALLDARWIVSPTSFVSIDLEDREWKARIEATFIAAGTGHRFSRKAAAERFEATLPTTKDVAFAAAGTRGDVAEVVVNRSNATFPHLLTEARAVPGISEAIVAPGVDHLVEQRFFERLRKFAEMLRGKLDQKRPTTVYVMRPASSKSARCSESGNRELRR